MSEHKQRKKMNLLKTVSVVLAAVLLVQFPVNAGLVTEKPEAVYMGSSNASVVFNNINYFDIKSTGSWADEAIYETGALNFIKGFGDRMFGRTTQVSKQEAIAIALRTAGLEADAQMAAEALMMNNKDQKTKSTLETWYDGFLVLAADMELITKQDLVDALITDQASLKPDSFRRDAPALRQEVAYWTAKALNISPIYDQQKLFNSYADWRKADTAKIPYIEGILQNEIMTGDDNGYFAPTRAVTREEVAQIFKNAEAFTFPLNGLERKTGTIEEISTSRDLSQGKDRVKKVYNIRSMNGALHTLEVQLTNPTTVKNKNEQTGTAVQPPEKELVVYKEGLLGKSAVLEKGDRIDYIVSADHTVKFVKVISSAFDTKYRAALVDIVDTAKRLLQVTTFFDLEIPDIKRYMDFVDFKNTAGKVNETYTYSNNLAVNIEGKISEIGKLIPGSYVILTVTNGVVTEIKTFELSGEQHEEPGLVKGIVEDNNPQLGYITLYNEDGTGTTPQSQGELAAFRTYSYLNQNQVEVLKNHEKAEIDDIKTGDSVFIKLDKNGNIVSISAVANYTVKYGKVRSKRDKGLNALVIEYDGGTRQSLDVDNNTAVIAENKLVNYSRLKEGDYVKLVLHITPKSTRIEEIIIQGSRHFITNVYKGMISRIDDISKKLIVKYPETLYRGQWQSEKNGFTSIKLANEYTLYFEDKKIDLSKVNKYLRDTEAYIAVEKDYGGSEIAVLVSFRNEEDAEKVYDDSISSTTASSSLFLLNKENKRIKYTDATIIVKDGRLVTGNSLSRDDTAYVVTNRSGSSGAYFAGVIQIDDRLGLSLPDIYRGRIKQINNGKEFTVESYSRLKGTSWEYANTPKTFKITYQTSIIDETGIVNPRDFIDYGEKTYIGRSVYIVADETNAVLVSTAPYGPIIASGDVYEITGGEIGEEGTWLKEPTGFKLKKVKTYDSASYMWTDSKEMTLNLLNNSMIFKNGKIVKPSELKKGNRIRVYKKDTALTGDAYIVIVES